LFLTYPQFKKSLQDSCTALGVNAVFKDWSSDKSYGLQEASKNFKMQLRKCFNLQCQQETIKACQQAMDGFIESNLKLLENPSQMQKDALKTLECFKFFLDHEFPNHKVRIFSQRFQHDFFFDGTFFLI
jgi:hypothetical protein